jgi:phage terminase large subunit-like protein
VNDLRRGSQRPTLLHEPPDAVDWAISDLAVEWAASVGYELDEWQNWAVRWAFVRRPDGLWAARDYGLEVPRQNGKNIVLEVIELVALFALNEDLVIHSAHRTDVSHEHFLSLKAHIEMTPELMDLMPNSPNKGFYQANGKESIELGNGNRLLFKSRQSGAGRGPRPKRLVFDEALILPKTAVGDMAPGMTAQRNPQILFASSPPKSDSEMLHDLRKRAEAAGDGDRLFYVAWNNPTDCDPDDRDAWYRVNPSLGYGRMTEISLQANRRLMSLEDFVREHIGIPEPPLDDEAHRPISDERWSECQRSVSAIVNNDCWALTVSPDHRWASFGVAGRTADGKVHVETLRREPGTDWVLSYAVQAWTAKRIPLRVHKTGPEGAFIGPLREAGVEVVEVSTTEAAQATGQFIDLANAGDLVHLGQVSLTKAVRNAEWRITMDGASTWSQRSSSVEITPLQAVTVALGGVAVTQLIDAATQVW